jgi:glycosyltransferase involved in cell wall biosynthesis
MAQPFSDSVSVVIPVYNGGFTLPELVHRLRLSLDKAVPTYEIILVNDGSHDDSWEQILSLARQFDCIRGIDLMRNYGQHNALLAGIRQARHEVIVTLDDDLQNPPEEIPKLLDRLGEEFDIVYGTPAEEKHSALRNVASRITKLALQTTMGAETASKVSAFRAFRTRVRDGFADFGGPFVCLDVLLTWSTARFTSVEVRHQSREAGKSNYTVGKLMMHAINMITGFSSLPLRLASIIGFAAVLFGLVVIAYVLGRVMLFGSSVPGFPFLASIITIFAGTQLFALGVIGEYLARVHFRAMKRPSYVIRQTSGQESGQLSYFEQSRTSNKAQ